MFCITTVKKKAVKMTNIHGWNPLDQLIVLDTIRIRKELTLRSYTRGLA